MQFVLTIGSTGTAAIDGISAAGADPEVMVHTPAADAEIVAHGRPTRAPVVPVSPSGCPTPAVVTRAVRELLGFEVTVVDAGAARPAGAPTIDLPGPAGADIRAPVAVEAARETFDAARERGRSLGGDGLLLAETIPGGTTTAMGVLAALGERPAVSSSLPGNPLELKRAVVDEALGASGLAAGDAAGDPVGAIRAAGDPVLAAVAGMAVGALGSGGRVVLGGGTQMSAAAALVRHAGADGPLAQATTPFVADDDTADVAGLADDLDVDLTVTDPGFGRADHPAMDAYVRGEAKEGVGMGGALALAAGTVGGADGVGMEAVRERVVAVYDRLLAADPGARPEAGQEGE